MKPEFGNRNSEIGQPWDAVWTPATTARDLAKWELAARDQQPRRFRVFVDLDFAALQDFPAWERLFRGIYQLRDILGQPRLGVDFYLHLEQANHFHTGVLGVLLVWLNRGIDRRLLLPSRDPFVQWVREWLEERLWPAHVCLGVRVRDEEHYHEQRRAFIASTRRLAPAPPRLWIWWPDVAEAGTDLRLHPEHIPNHRRDVYRLRKEAAEEAERWRHLIAWIVCGGRYAADLARMGTDYHRPVWVLRDEHNPDGVQWTPGERPARNAEDGTENAEEEQAA